MPEPLLRLDAPREEVLKAATQIVTSAWSSFEKARVGQPPISDQLSALMKDPLPTLPTAVSKVLADAAEVLDESMAQPRPRYLAFIGASGLEIGVIADMLAATFDVNLATWAAAATFIEEQSLQWVGELVGFPVDGGTFTSGGTVSNITALAAARERTMPGTRKTGMANRRAAVYCSAEAHYSVIRAAEVLGFGSDAVRAIAIDSKHRMIASSLRDAIEADVRDGITPVAIIATGGTTLTGAIDPLDEIAEIAKKHGVWVHVDGAYGLAAALAPSTKALFKGLEKADSVSIDAHKWLFVPKACGVIMMKDKGALVDAFAHDAGYLPHQYSSIHAADLSLEYSRPFRALKIWMALRTHGANAFVAAVERNMQQAYLLTTLIKQEPLLEAWSEPELSVIPYRYKKPGLEGAELDEFNRRLAKAMQDDARVFLAPATIDGQVWLRPCFVNYRTSDDDVKALIDITLEIAVTL